MRTLADLLTEQLVNPTPRAVYPAMKGTERNQPCPCGSGIKYKRCCARQPIAEVEALQDLARLDRENER